MKARLKKKHLNPNDAEGLLRLLVGNGTFQVKIEGATPELGLSADASSREARRDYSASFANDLESQSQQIGRLLRHGPTVGSEREELLRALLERHVPGRYHVATGFIDGFPHQHDVLIYDRIDFAPLFRAGNLVVVPSEAVRAVIEVKSTLDGVNLCDALEHLSSAYFAGPGGPPIFRGAFAFRGIGRRAIIEAIKYHHRNFGVDDLADDLRDPVVSINQMVSAVCVLGKTIVITGFAPSPAGSGFPFTPAAAEVVSEAGRNAQAAVFFDLIDRHLRHPFEGGFQRGSLLDVVRNDIVQGNAVAIYGSSAWGPYSIGAETDDIETDVAAHQRWLAGGDWTRKS